MSRRRCALKWTIGLSAACSTAVEAETIHVAPGESIQAAIDIANPGDEILVQPGLYNEIINFLGKTIELRSSGGPDVTTIDGASLADTVVRCVSGEGAETLLEGFTITGGETTGSGGGMLNDGSNPTVTNCIFRGNTVIAFDDGGGGGMGNINASPIITGCVFDDNLADGFKRGAGMFNDGGGPIVTNCTFIDNLNDGFEDGGGMYNRNANTIVSGCTFIGNTVSGFESGGGVCNQGGEPQFLDCEFEFNIAGNGGGIQNTSSSPLILNCTFASNATLNTSGAVRNSSGAAPRIDSCTFVDNSSEIGGAMDNSGSGPAVIVNCTFQANWADYAGGVRNFESSPFFANCTFDGNIGNINGGGMRNTGASPTLVNCLFVDNTTTTVGGAMRNVSESAPNIVNCTFVRNHAGDSGGGVYTLASSPVIANCILRENSDSGGMDESAQVHVSSGTATVQSSCVQGGWSGAGSNNIDADPQFVNPKNDDFALAPGSPCIDAADNSAVPPDLADLDDDDDLLEPTPLDLLGAARFVDDPDTADTGLGAPPLTDMGAIEFQVASCTADLNGDGVVNAADLAVILGNWGPIPPGDPAADLNGDGTIGPADLAILLGNWGACGKGF